MQMLGASAASKRTLAKANARRILHDRRLLDAVSGEPLLPPGDPLTQCLGVGPVCPEGGFVECEVGGIVGCMCPFIRECEPDVYSCYFKNGKVTTYCGF
ncbi:hypothetical protein M758_6G043100 [Ceratodon purpureus]|nr:hypothetical protein KC19_6G043600 [Ceratodon purpureus]KAG0612637.1 hypothetical protein M758_6G043100 [Ceratodon purpureus]